MSDEACEVWTANGHLFIENGNGRVIGFSPKTTIAIANALKELDHGQEAKTGGEQASD